jgi:lipopolysaccharide export system permease protein
MKLIDRYMVAELSKRLAVVLVIVLGSLVIERILRLFDMVSMKGGPFYMVWEMAFMLLPHYLGLALPAGFFVSIYLVASSFNTNNEFDVLLSGGISPVRFVAPFFAAAIVLTGLSIGLFGYAQPYSRYAYRGIHYLVNAVPWGAQVPERVFATVDKQATVTADHASPDGSELAGVYVHLDDHGHEVAITAKKGQLLFGPQKIYYRLLLTDGIQLTTKGAGNSTATRFNQMMILRPFATTTPPFRSRGNDVRELSLSELAEVTRAPRGEWTPTEAAAELHARLVRAFSLLFLPFLTIPLALTAKRRQRSAGLILGGVLLVVYHYSLQTLEGLAQADRLPVATLWLPWLLFAALSAVLFWRTQRNPGENFLDPLLNAVSNALHWIGARLRWRKASTQP